MLRFTVIVPTCGRPRQLAACVRSLRHIARPPGGFEVVIVSDGGPPPAPELTAGDTGNAARIRVVTQAHAGPAAARNLGARLAEGECLAFTDDDCRPDPDWLLALDRALRLAPAALAGGRTMNALPANTYAAASHSLVTFVAAHFAGGTAGRFFASNNMAVARLEYFAAGGFDERYPFAAEDRDFSHRWSAAARPSVSVADALVHHAHPLTLATFVRQHASYGRGAWHFRRSRAEEGSAPPVSSAFYLGSLRHPFRSGGRRRARLAALVALAHAAYAAGLAGEWLRQRVHAATGAHPRAPRIGRQHTP